jgi:hypothetical protein
LKRSYLSVPSANFFFLTAVASPFMKLPRKLAAILMAVEGAKTVRAKSEKREKGNAFYHTSSQCSSLLALIRPLSAG